MMMRKLGNSGLEIAPIVFGGNVFGWTIDEKTSFAVLDAFIDHGFNAIDTADVYSGWVKGNSGGESETIIGKWLKARPGVRDKVVIFTKVGYDLGNGGNKGLSKDWIAQASDASLRRLGVETIDLYFSHAPDNDTPHDQTLEAYDRLIKAGKVRAIGASNYTAEQLTAASAVSQAKGLPNYTVLQPEYNLYNRSSFEGELRDYAVKNNLGVVTYFSLASGFLTGKYRSKADIGDSQRGYAVEKYLNAKGQNILKALDMVADRHNAAQADVALAWLMARDGVTAPIASVTSLSQVAHFAKAADLKLTTEDMAVLTAAG